MAKPTWIKKLAGYAPPESGNQQLMTVREICRQTGLSKEKVRKLLHEAHEMGMLVVGSKNTRYIDGRVEPVPAFRILSKPRRKVQQAITQG